jgi:DNA-binding CsgD family transcriptional regulator
MIELDLGLVEDGQRQLNESLPFALRASDIQTTVTHLGQMLRAYSVSGKISKIIDTVHQMLEFLSMAQGLLNEVSVPLLIACQQLSQLSQANLANEVQGCLSWLEKSSLRYDTPEVAAALAEAKGWLALKTHPGIAWEQFSRAAAAWESIDHLYDQARALAAQGNALSAISENNAARSIWHQSLNILNALSSQLDQSHRDSFLNSQIVRTVRQSEEQTGRETTIHPGELTTREAEVLRLVAEGLTNAQIAEALVLSPLTINAHLRSIFNKLDVTTRTAAVHRAAERGWI